MKFLTCLFVILLLSCNSTKKAGAFTAYQSEKLIIKQVSPHVYQHISFLDTDSFGKVSCNGMIVVDGNEAIVFDTPVDDQTSEKLLHLISKQLKCKVKAVVATHFHTDCLGGLDAFHHHQIPSYAHHLTIELAKAKGFAVPRNGFSQLQEFQIGNQKVYAQFFGEGHTRDNTVAYFPAEKILFGGCLIKEVGSGKGNLEDANVKDWPATVRKIKAAYPEMMTVIPGHGATGNSKLLDYTITLFEE